MSGKGHMGRVAELPCSVCGSSPVEVHHVLEGRTPGRKSSDYLTIPLCPSCHRDNHNGIHGQHRMWDVMRKTEMGCLADTIARLCQ